MEMLKKIWRFAKKIKLKRENIILKKRVYFNDKTVFEDHILINEGCHIYNTYISRGSYIGTNSALNHTKIGSFCSIGNDVRVVLGNHPIHRWISTHPAFFSSKKQAGFTFVEQEKWINDDPKYDGVYCCCIENDVWIGDGAKIMSGVKISNGSVIGSGAIVTHSTEPFGIYVGVPAKKIGSRFDEYTIDKLQSIKWWNSNIDSLKNSAHLFDNYDNLTKLGETLK